MRVKCPGADWNLPIKIFGKCSTRSDSKDHRTTQRTKYKSEDSPERIISSFQNLFEKKIKIRKKKNVLVLILVASHFKQIPAAISIKNN